MRLSLLVAALLLLTSLAVAQPIGQVPTNMGKAAAEKSATGFSGLPPDAQGPISTALGKGDSGYWVHRSAEGFRGENLGRALSAEFTRAGAEVRSQNLRWGLEMRGYGYGDAVHRVKSVAPRVAANRVEYRRDGITEWFENGPLGLEQGFTLAHPPGNVNGQALTVELGMKGELVPSVDAGGKALRLRSKNGESALRYTGLTARDATGRELRSWLEVQGKRLLVRVEDEGARYPVVVDPWIQQAELTASDGLAGDGFGHSFAMDGSTAVIGALNHSIGSNLSQGAVYVFVQNSDGTWSQQAELTASDGVAGDNFGSCVALSGSTVVVGVPTRKVGSNSGQGAAYVFAENGGMWSQQAELTASDGAAGDGFGCAAASGGTIVVGAPGRHMYQGAAYVFVQNSDGTWSQQAELTASDGGNSDYFGAVAVSGSTVVVGAPYHHVGSNISQGAAYIFVPNGGTWSQQAELTSSDGASFDYFGALVAVDGGTVAVGASNHNANQGAAYVFEQNGNGTWSQQAELTASDERQYDYFGANVALSGNTVMVGAPNHPDADPPPKPGPGAAYVFVQNSDGTWSQQAELTPSDGKQGDTFGYSLGVSGSTAMVGAYLKTVGSNLNQGAVYVFGSSDPLYTLSAAPSRLSVAQGGRGTSTITIRPLNGFSGSVSLSVLGLPSGVTAAFSPNPATTTSTVTVTASETATTGTATVTVTSTSGNLKQTTPLTLTVTTSVTLSPTSLSFGNEAVNKTSAAKTVTLKNTGTITLTINNVAASAGFTISTNTCGVTLAAHKTCKVSVTFTPTQLGVVTGTLSLTDNASGSPQTVALSGTGIADATLAPASTTYAKQKVGTTSAAKTFTLTNDQSVALTNIAISTTGDFAVSATTCGTSLAGKGKCTVSVEFTPKATGTRTGQLSVSDSASGSPQTSNLKGTGK